MRRNTSKILGWVFGLALSVLFISLWGRVVVVDSDTLADAAAPLAGATVVTDRFADWLQAELIESGVEPGVAIGAADTALSASAVDDVLESLVDEVVFAAANPSPSGSVVDVGAILAPAVPEMTASLAIAGSSLSDDQINTILANLDPLVITEPGERPPIGPSSQLANRLGIATFLAVVVLFGSGTALVMTADNAPAELRQLLERAALGGLSFAVLLRFGSWVLDPGGGRAPLSEAFSVILGKHWMVPLAVAVAAASAAAIIWVFFRRSRIATRGQPGDGDRPTLDIAA